MSGTWWEEEPERKLTGIVLPSWDDDPDNDDHDPGPAAPPRGGYRPTGTEPPQGGYQPVPPNGDRPADPLTDPLDSGWWQAAPATQPERLVPVVPSGPPPAWPPATPDATDPANAGAAATGPEATGHPQARVELPPLTAAAPAALVSRSAAADTAAPRREFPRYIAGELILPGTGEPAATLDARTQPIETWDRAAEARTQPAETWAPQPTSPASQPASQPGADRFAARPPHTPPPVTPAPPEEADASADPTRSLPGVQFTAPAKPRPAPEPQPPAVTARTMPAATMPPGATPPETAPRPGPPHPVAPPPGLPEASVPPPPRPVPPSMPPAPTPPAPAPGTAPVLPPTAGAGATQPAAWPAQPSGHPAAGPAQDTLPAALQAAVHPAPPARAAEDAATMVQPAVPAVVHAAQQSTPGAAQDGPAPPVPAKKARESAPHPAFPDATARTMRILPIAADLLPLEITELRRLRMVRRLVLAGVAVCVALLLGWYVVADAQTGDAQSELTAVQDSRRDLNRKKATYTQLESTRQQIKDITTQLGIVMERDMSWSALLVALRKAAPKNVAVANVTGSLNLEDPAGDAGDVVGTLTLSGTAPSKDEVAAYVDTLGTVAGLANPFPSETTQDDTGLHFTIRVDITKAALGGRFTSPSAAPSASGGK
ncbi:hypothetical protein AB0J72_09150 [Dactylosporangium sp. NPDC049742]|uniref:hypothetical protein n=1 Tax=Dactylosporangium sp. NPDC049742 TaxID=3154737 RepID=UPI003416A2C1